ncbi:uncharacterized protein LOC132293952 [Cornus florida]|uniref:uncharacterized protein LOC132293952 n=1 Tax=Cornus florida TaxID=4283 RepID=UPI00289FEF0C|nr:uncharacterized protein LOC132293952 [Cornus florida]
MIMAALSSSSSQLIGHRIFRPPSTAATPFSFLSLFLFKPQTLRIETTPLRRPSPFLFTSPSSRSLLSSSSSSSFPESTPHSLSNSQVLVQEFDAVDESDDELEDSVSEEAEIGGDTTRKVLDSPLSIRERELKSKLPSLSVKEKKELASYAHSLGKKLKSQQVGKSGVTDSVATALIETLEKNELIKIKIHGSCPAELKDAVKQLEEATGSVVVGQIGRTVILYRPSLSKLKAEEKKKQNQEALIRRRMAYRSSFQNKGQVPRLSGRTRRGSSKF